MGKVVVVVVVVVVSKVVVVGKVVEIDCEKPMKRNIAESPNEVCIGVAVSVKKYLCRFYYSISQKVITLSGRKFITVSGVLLHYRAVITVSGVYYIIGWYSCIFPVR